MAMLNNQMVSPTLLRPAAALTFHRTGRTSCWPWKMALLLLLMLIIMMGKVIYKYL